MAEIPYFVRFKDVTTLVDTDSLFLDDVDSDVPKKIAFSDFKTEVNSGVVSNRTLTIVDDDYTILNTDRNIEIQKKEITITLPIVDDITHYEDICLINNCDGEVYIYSDSTIFDDNNHVLYQGESFTIQKGQLIYLLK